MVDTHAHLEMCEPGDTELVEAARRAGVTRILAIGMDERSNRQATAAADRFDEVYACVGRHPNAAGGFDGAAAREIEAHATAHRKVVAIGETGLDFHRDRVPPDEQRAAFDAQIEIARRTRLPLVIHMRDSFEETYERLGERAEGLTVVWHCFSLAPEDARKVIDRGWYCSFAGNVSYPSAGDLQDSARLVPAELLLVETDAPYLSPQPMRGRPNQPAHVVETARFLAGLRGVPYEELEAQIESNATRAFGW